MSKLIIALDFAEKQDALDLVEQLDPSQCALKVGSEMFTLLGTDFVSLLVDKGYKVFLDLKFHDIPNTVAQACRSAAQLGVWMINVHASGGSQMMVAARDALEGSRIKPLLIAVTVLTSMNEQSFSTLGVSESIERHVQRLASMACAAGLDGVVCSAFEVPQIKQICGESFLTVTPGIRLASNSHDDQSRVVTPVEAIQLGSDFLVVGRPVTKAAEPARVVKAILQSLT
ncbi:orotidine 5`-phosphate decarboxylase [Legionella birminghamensis]|uniref:Orotidine 5'-phosphate decarboxylase n=1 Tax=Legionella birminghamensis TaxID=28083 RepID=A0A378IH85_9GAMM|nr:orotidine-5'-phosphate decarboxylase [Legionella birminghamensis]KTC69282.1 orotidine 5`-phosphate decarboxylase [Legionella birminghamensis]STX31544.1 orotidine 5`-phosphate decarboxylase [Legionella birminghamensis]